MYNDVKDSRWNLQMTVANLERLKIAKQLLHEACDQTITPIDGCRMKEIRNLLGEWQSELSAECDELVNKNVNAEKVFEGSNNGQT